MSQLTNLAFFFAPDPIAGRMTFKLADEVLAGTKKPLAERVPLGRHGRPKTLRASSRPAVVRLHLCNRHDSLGRWRINDRLTMRLRD
jgi:hypothetical protein